MRLFGWFRKHPHATTIKVAVESAMHLHDVKPVYLDPVEGYYVKGAVGDTFYLQGGIQNFEPMPKLRGDPFLWKRHIGLIDGRLYFEQ